MNGLLEVDVTVTSTGKSIKKVIEHSPGALSDKDKQKSLKNLSLLKFHPREQENNRMMLAKGERLYETSLREEREYIANVISEFEAVLDRQNQMDIKKAYIKIEEILNRIDNEEWF